MIQLHPSDQELRALSLMSDDVLSWLRKMRSEWDVKLRYLKDEVETRHAQGWAQCLDHIIEIAEESGSRLETIRVKAKGNQKGTSYLF